MIRFDLILSPSEALVRELADREPENLFVTPAFMRGMVLRGSMPCLLGLWEGDQLVQGCLGEYKKGRLSRSLEIRLVPEFSADSPFWPGLLAACKRLGIWDLSLYAVAHQQELPLLGLVMVTETGKEFYLPLGSDPVPAPTSSNHRRSMAKAAKNGLVVHRTQSVDAVAPHLAMMEASMDRRTARGEDVAGRVQILYYRKMLEAGAGEFFQVREASGNILSSLFFLRSKAGAYYQSAGTSPEGMSLGASPFLVWHAAEMLRLDGVTKFCLGGSTLNNTGLVRFKSGFGALEEPFQSLVFGLAHPLKRWFREILGKLKK